MSFISEVIVVPFEFTVKGLDLGAHRAMVSTKCIVHPAGRGPAWTTRVLADGADGLSNWVSTPAEKTTLRVLDWVHISMRL